MTTIVTRTGKGSALTFAEGDANFTNLNNDKIELTNLSVSVASTPSGGGTLSYSNTTGVFTFTPAEQPASGIGNVVEDTTPQLGGDLDVNAKKIVSVSNGNIVIEPNGNGKSLVKNINYNEAPYTLTYAATITPDAANGNVQTITLNGNLTFSAFANPIAGQSITLIVNTNGTGRTLTSTMKWAGGEKTISTTSTTDIISVFYDGTNYWASLSKDFK